MFARHVDYLQIGERRLSHFEIKMGDVDYGFGMCFRNGFYASYRRYHQFET